MENILAYLGGIVSITFLVEISRFIFGDNFSFVILSVIIFQLIKNKAPQRRIN